MARHNWGKIRGEYITGSLSQRQLAQKYGVSASQLAQRASKEGWRAARLEHRRKVEEKARQKAAERKAETMAAQLVDIGTAAESLAAMVAEVSQDTRMLRVGRTKKPDTKAIRNLTGALKDLVDVLRDVYELPDLRDKQRDGGGNGAREVHVVFDDDEEADAVGGDDPDSKA